jgi:hypothetical protein
MSDLEILAIASELPLPDGWGFIVGDTPDRPLIIGSYQDGGLAICIAAKLADGREVRGNLAIYHTDDVVAVYERAGRMIRDMLAVVKDLSARWN